MDEKKRRGRPPKNPEAKERGRPSKYNPEFHPALVEALARNGLTNEQIAEKMHIAISTINEWCHAHTDFSIALKRGREEPDSKVERTLYRMAIGFEYDAEKPMTVGTGMGESEIQIDKYRERVLPNVTAQIFWLKNRRPDRWRDKQELEVDASMEIKHTFDPEGI